jgi:squalene synthase HpnC
MDTEEAYKFCENLTKKHYENFPVGSLLISKGKRKFVYSVYAFARTADDIADSDELNSKEKVNALIEYEKELQDAYQDNFSNSSEHGKIFTALSNTKDKLNIPIKEFRNLLTAFMQDAVKDRYQTFQELIDYSENSANPIGHLVLYVFGFNEISDEKIFRLSGKICTALQLTNFWQDVSRDLEISRIYIPEEVMHKFNYKVEWLFKKIENENFKEMMKELVEKTKAIFTEGKEIIDLVGGRLRLELKATILGGNEILKKIEEINYNVLSQRVKVEKSDKINIIFRTFFKSLN